ncbi:MAG: mechanosensitive ion channel [Nitrosomonadales bacterium]|nr:mechanosensitive ion channel [Nitrosomonadales bacterium]MBL0038394.1 mechanosensitive ion channel [Nitrosomonadales bacterium]
MSSSTHNLLIDFFSDLEQTAILWQIALLALSFVLAWGINHLLLGRLSKSEWVSKIGLGGISRVAFPLVALLIVLIGRAVLKNWHSINILNIVVPLLSALMLIRLVVYIIRQVFVSSSWLQSSEQFIAMIIWVGFALYLTGYLPEVIDAMDHFGFHVGKQRISLLLVLSGILSIFVTMLVAMWLGKTFEHKVMATENLDMNLRVVLSKLIRACLVVVGVLIALPLAGIDITVLSVFGGALGVGIGFGLQKIASNYVSGFIILLDRSIHPGDVLTVDGRFGKVSQLTTRYVVLENNDGTEAIIPNEILITSTVINHSFTNRQIRVGITIQISYQSDLHLAMEIMKQAAENQPRVLADPETKVYLKSFSDNGIDLEMGVWISDPEEGQLNLRSDINMEIWRKFQASGIEIPYPQRDVRIISGKPSV